MKQSNNDKSPELGDNSIPPKTDLRARKPLLLAIIGLVAVVMLVTVLGMVNRSGEESSSDVSDSNQAPSAVGTLITTGDSEFGTMLFNEKKQAIYIWELEESTNAECYGDCAEAWPPVLTDGAPRADDGVNSSLLGTTERADGSTQVTYNGHPLYYYAHEGAGEVKCHNISTHGGIWWVIHPNGDRAA
jgi:predicted lipoprotein with Yx(FWY)xxD motif